MSVCYQCGYEYEDHELVKIDGTHYNDKNWLKGYAPYGVLICLECYGK